MPGRAVFPGYRLSGALSLTPPYHFGTERKVARRVQNSPRITRSRSSWRWGLLTPHWSKINGKYFVRRLQIVQAPWFAVLLTKICKADTDRDPHNHSRSFISFILSGGYTEEVYSDPEDLSVKRVRVHRRFSCHVMRSAEAHSITEIQEPLRTLAFCGRMKDELSFWTPEGRVSWRLYGRQ